MYVQDKRIKATFIEFREILNSIPENVSDCILLDNNRLVYKDIVKTGVYRHLESVRRGDFYIPDKKEIDIIDRDKYPSNEAAYQSLWHFLHKELREPEDFSTYICRVAYQTFAGGGFLSDFMNILNSMEFEFRSEKNAARFASIMMDVNNETRMAELKGHKPNEMKKVQPLPSNPKPADGHKAEKRIYPNDPCPCGSGKKYKKCCGR